MLTLRFCDPVLMARRAKLALLALAFAPFCAPFGSIPKPYEAPEGQILIRDSYQFLGAGQPVFEAITGPGGGPYLLPPHPLALHWCGFDDTGNSPPTWSTVGDLKNVPADQYPPALSTYVDKTKRLSVIAADDSLFGNPTEDPAATAPVFSLQRDFSGYDCPDSQHDCTQADGSGYYVVPAGVIARVHDRTGILRGVHYSFRSAFYGIGGDSSGEKWQVAACLKWLADAAFSA